MFYKLSKLIAESIYLFLIQNMLKTLFKIKYLFSLVLLIAAVVYVYTAYQSNGYYHADEHYQIIEFANYHLGINTSKDLPWEYHYKMRSALQPIIGATLFKGAAFANILNPYHQAFILRLATAALSILLISFYFFQTRKELNSKQKQLGYLLLSFFLWFIPVISVRFSSETWAGLTFLLAIAVYFKLSKKAVKPYLLGLLMGISFLFRFQMAFAIIGFILWIYFIEKRNTKFILKIGLGLLSAQLLGTLLDSWFYGHFVFTPWTYFKANIIDGAAANFGTSEWYFYFKQIIYAPSLFVGIPIFLSGIFLIIKHSKHYLVWILSFFLIGHSLVGHKELRFLFPMVYFLPHVLAISFSAITKYIHSYKINRPVQYLLISVFASVNIIGLFAMSQKSASNGGIEITRYIHSKYGDKPINLIYCPWSNPYNPWNSLPVKFYAEKNLTETSINNLCEFNDSLCQKNTVNLLIFSKLEKDNSTCNEFLLRNNITLECKSIHDWFNSFNNLYPAYKYNEVLELYKVQMQ